MLALVYPHSARLQLYLQTLATSGCVGEEVIVNSEY